ncbi:MAG: AAA family ATPase, partial [Methanomicrobium sp.]|nr:AAA family ATPase [Methanomicrobium sp.]
MQDWVEKYRPQSLQDIVGNQQAVRQMMDWAKNWKTGSLPLLLYGKPGIGKTSSAYALANDMNWEVIELNASDQRTKGIIEKIAGSTATTMSLLGSSRKLLLLDEADNLHGTADKGGARAIMDVIKNSRQPIILIANDLYGVAKELKALCEPVQFRALQTATISKHLRYICSSEKKRCSDEALAEISESSSGDMRSAVNMLFAAGTGIENLTAETVSTAKKDERATIFELVGAVLKGKDDRRLMEMSYELSDTPDTIEQWLEKSLVQIKDIKSRAEAYRYLSLS